MKAIIVFAALASCIACQGKPQALLTTRERNQAFLEAVAHECGLPPPTLKLIGEDHVQLQPAPDAKYESVDCALGKLLPKKDLKLGFVGNEYYSNQVQR